MTEGNTGCYVDILECFAPLLDSLPNFSICRKNGRRFHYSFIAILLFPPELYVFPAEMLSRMDLAYSALCLSGCLYLPHVPGEALRRRAAAAANHAKGKRK